MHVCCTGELDDAASVASGCSCILCCLEGDVRQLIDDGLSSGRLARKQRRWEAVHSGKNMFKFLWRQDRPYYALKQLLYAREVAAVDGNGFRVRLWNMGDDSN